MKRSSDFTSSSATAVGKIFQIANGTVQSCNKDAKRILGCTSEQLMGASTFDFAWRRTIQKDGSDFPSETHPAIASIDTGQAFSGVVMGFYRPNGELVWLSIDTLPLFKANGSEPYGVEVSFIDISDRPNTETALQIQPVSRSQTKSKKELIKLLPGVIYIYDAIAHHNVYLNAQVFDSLDYTPQEVAELDTNFVTQVVHPEDFARLQAHLKKLETSESGKTLKFEYRMRHKNGEWR